MLLGKLGASLLGNLSTGTKVKIKVPRQGVKRAGAGTIKSGQNF